MPNGLLKENWNALYIVRWVGLLSKHQFSLLDFVVYLKGKYRARDSSRLIVTPSETRNPGSGTLPEQKMVTQRGQCVCVPV